MYINLFKSAVSDEVERIEVKPHMRIKDIPELKGIDFSHVLIFVNGFQKNENYILRKNDVCTLRYFPASAEGFSEWWNGGVSWVQGELDKLSSKIWAGINSVADSIDSTCKYLIKQALAGLEWVTNNYYYDQSSYDYSTTVNNTIINADNVTKSPNMRGCSNQLETGATFPLVIGKSYFVPRMCAKPYITPTGDYGYYQTYHALFDLGYGSVNVSDICLGLKKLATNSAKQRNGAIVIDGDYDSSKYDIHLEIQETEEVSLYDQMVVQQDINAELLFPKPIEGETPRNFVYDGISSPYPQKIELEFYLEGLVGKITEGDDKGKDCAGTIKIKCEYSTDGGVTFQPFGKIGNVSGISYDSTTGETTISMKNYHSMRFVATRTFSASEVYNATNHVVELRIQRTTVHDEDSYIYDTVSLASVRTYTYDPELSTSITLVKQAPVCAKDRQRITRLGVTITSNERLYNLQEFNCIVQALGRTCTENNGYYTWSNVYTETCNPASMALRVLQCGMLGEYIYTDSEIDMQKFGEFYKFCDEYDINDAQGNHVGICANGVVTKQTKLSDLLSKILAVGRASRIIRIGKISLYIDKPIEYTSLILNNQNVLEANNSKNFDELPSGVKCQFVNEDNFNQDDVMYIDYANAPARTSPQYKTIGKNYEFQTNVEQIKKNALYDLAVLKLRPETWVRKVTSEGSLAFIGAKIEVQDDTIAVGIGDGAEIKDLIIDENEEYITGIKTDGEFDVTDLTQEYGVRIQVATIEYGLKYITRKVVVSEVGVYRNFVFDSPISLEELILPANGDILSFGVLGKICYESICVGKKADSNGTFELTLVPYVSEIYTADSGQLPEFESNTTAPNYFTPPEQKPPITQEEIQEVKNTVIDIENGTAEIEPPDTITGFTAVAERDGIQITWNPITDDGLKNVLKDFVIEISKNMGSSWSPLVSVYKNEYFYEFKREGVDADGYPEADVFADWRFRIKAENIYGSSSASWTIAFVDATSYGTWIPQSPVIATPRVSHRTVTMNFSQPVPCYGSLVFLVSIQRYDEFADQYPVWFKPELNADPYNSAMAYKDPSATEHFVTGGKTYYYLRSDNSFTQTLPLEHQLAEQWLDVHKGQGELERLKAQFNSSGVEVDLNVISETAQTQAIDTNYYYRVWCLNLTTGVRCALYSQVLITAKATSAYDIVDSAIITNKIADGAVVMDKLHANCITAEKMATRNLTALGAFIGSIYGGQIDTNPYVYASEYVAGKTYYLFNSTLGTWYVAPIQPTAETFVPNVFYLPNPNYTKPVGEVSNFWKNLDSDIPEFRIGNDINKEIYELDTGDTTTDAEYMHYLSEATTYHYSYQGHTGDKTLARGIYFKIANFIVTAISSIIRGLFLVKNKTTGNSFVEMNPEITDQQSVPPETVNVKGDLVIGSKSGGTAGTITSAGAIASSGGLSGASLSVTGAISGGAITGTSLSVTGALTGAGLTSNGAVSVNSNGSTVGGISTTGAVSGSSLSVTGTISGNAITSSGAVAGKSLAIDSVLSASVSGSTGSVSVTGNESVSGTLTAGSLTAGAISTTGITSTGNIDASGKVLTIGKVSFTGGTLNNLFWNDNSKTLTISMG